MPFTFSHPAIILPFHSLTKKWFSLTGLIIGSLTPDFEYFLRMTIKGEYGHTLAGVFWFNLPLSILLTFLFHCIVKNALFNHLPPFFRKRFYTFKQFNWNNYFVKNWLIVIISIIIGTFSHLFWDAFTHYDGYFVEKIPYLKKNLLSIPLFNILQHTSTLIGGLIIFLAIYKLPTFNKIESKDHLRYWLIFSFLTFCITLIRFFYGLELKQYGNVIVTLISAIMLSLIITPFFTKEIKTMHKVSV